MRITAPLLILGSCLAVSAYAQYSDNLKDISIRSLGRELEPGQHKATPIGNLGDLETVIDLRGFVPMSFYSRAASAEPDKLLLNQLNIVPADTLQWYKIPTKKALLMVYYGALDANQLAGDTSALEARFRGTRFLSESEVKGETAVWCKLAYQLAKNSDSLFERIAGDGLESAEPTTVLFTKASAFVILNFRYNSVLRRNSTGQVLVALEFARSSREFKTFYQLYSTTLTNKTTAEAASEAAKTIATRAIAAMF